MKDKILRFARGDFSEVQSNIVMSENQIYLDVEEGRRQYGSIYIGNESGVHMKGLLYSECPNLYLKDKVFSGKEASIEYVFSAEDIRAGETFEGDIIIVSNCGEVRIPVYVSVIIPTISGQAVGKVSDLSGFATVAKDYYEEALQMFVSEDFSRILLYRDIEKKLIYDTLVKDSSPRVAMEEFLVAVRKKTRVMLEVDRNNISYDNCYAPFEDEVILQASTWGGIRVSITSKAAFIRLEENVIWTNEYKSGRIPVKYIIDADKMIDDVNSGSILISTPNQTIEIKIMVRKYNKDKQGALARKRFFVKTMRYYVERRLADDNTAEARFIENLQNLVDEYRNYVPEETLGIVKTYIAAMKFKGEVPEIMFEQWENIKRPSDDADIDEVINYAAISYIKAISVPVTLRQKYTEKAVNEITFLYENGYRDPILFWLLCNVDIKYSNPRVMFYELMEYIKEGCTSPIIYIEFNTILRRSPELMHEWHESMILPLAWGIRKKLFTQEMAMAFTFHVSRIKEYSSIVYSALDRLYDEYGLEEIVNTVCTMLIRAQKMHTKYLKWYERGIEKQLRITGIYEAYMSSLPDGKDNIVPNQIMRYFMYDNRLAEREKQILYASSIRDKENNPSIYKSYSVMVSNFARKQLEAGHLNDALSVIYVDCIKFASIDETVATCLPKVMFKHRIVCNHPQIRSVCVTHRICEGEQIQDFINNTAYVDIFSEDACIALIDVNGNRHIGNDYYTMEKMINLDSYAEKCYQIAPDNKNLLTYMYYKCEREANLNRQVIKVRQRARRNLELRTEAKKKNLATLIQYCYDHAEGEHLDELLSMADFGEADKASRQKWIEMLIVRRLGDRAVDAVNTYGYEGIELRHLVKLCDEALAESDSSECNNALLNMAYFIFENGKYTKDIIRYLARYYAGSTDSMFSIWEAAKGFGIERKEIEENLLARLLYIEDNSERVQAILDSYIETGEDKNLKKGFVSFMSYKYLTDNTHISDIVWGWIEQNILTEYNVVCTLAVLKKLSEQDNLSENQIKFCDVKMCQMINKGIVMPFFTSFSKYMKLPEEIDNKLIIMCVAKPGTEVILRYKTQNSAITTTRMREVFYGIYVREIVVFRDEKIIYEFSIIRNSKKVILGTGSAPGIKSDSDEISRYVMIDKMIEHYSKNNMDELFSCMETYIKLDEASYGLFEML